MKSTTSRQRVKAPRTIRLLTPLNEEGRNALVTITTGRTAADYWVSRLPADFGTAFLVEKLGSDDRYHVNTDGHCDCKGHTYHGHCKHVDGLAALVKAGRL
jgi:hypothetical protein